jgi:hypothetical protein
MRTFLLCALAALLAAAALPSGAAAREVTQAAQAPALTDSARALVAGSREAIISTGVSAAFFDEHFSVARVVDSPGDRRVVWRLSVGAHEATVNDSVGFYTEAGRRVDTHSVAATLSKTSDITRTITRRRAELIMRRCIGPFSNARVEYRAHGDEWRAALLLTAHRVLPPPPGGRAARARGERGARELTQTEAPPQLDRVRSKRRGPSPAILLGAVDLVTGECTVGYGQTGPLPPAPPGVRQR